MTHRINIPLYLDSAGVGPGTLRTGPVSVEPDQSKRRGGDKIYNISYVLEIRSEKTSIYPPGVDRSRGRDILPTMSETDSLATGGQFQHTAIGIAGSYRGSQFVTVTPETFEPDAFRCKWTGTQLCLGNIYRILHHNGWPELHSGSRLS